MKTFETKDQKMIRLFGRSIKPVVVKKPKTEKVNLDCDRVGISNWCCNTDVKMVERKSARNVYNGAVVAMCKECRISNNGAFKIVKNDNTTS